MMRDRSFEVNTVAEQTTTLAQHGIISDMNTDEKPPYDRVSANKDSPNYVPLDITVRLGVLFNNTPQTQVVELCVSEGWIQRYKKDWKGRPVMNGDEWVLGPKLKGVVELYWKP